MLVSGDFIGLRPGDLISLFDSEFVTVLTSPRSGSHPWGDHCDNCLIVTIHSPTHGTMEWYLEQSNCQTLRNMIVRRMRDGTQYYWALDQMELLT